MTKRAVKTKPRRPNVVPRTERIVYLILGVILTAYGVAGLLSQQMLFKGKRFGFGLLEGGSVWLMATACFIGAAVLFSVVMDHYDTRDNEQHYRAFRRGATILGWGLVASALVTHLSSALLK